jgi:hypothetical protein
MNVFPTDDHRPSQNILTDDGAAATIMDRC